MDNAGNVKDGESMKYPLEDRLPYAEALFQLMNLQEKTMKKIKKSLTTLLTAAVLLISVFVTGCTKLSEAPNRTPTEADAPAEYDGFGVYVKLERNDVSSIALHGGSFTKVGENADGSLLKAGEWLFTGDDIAQLSKEENSSVLFTVSARDADDTLLGEGTFLYDVAQEKLYVTISADGVTCSTSDAPDASADVPPVLTLPILDEIDRTVTVGTSGSSLLALQAAARLLDWGMNTGLGTDEISDAASTWLAAKNNELTEIQEQAAEGITVFLCTHQLRYAQEICTTYGLMNSGRLFAAGNITELRAMVCLNTKLRIKASCMPKDMAYREAGDHFYEVDVASEHDIPLIVKRIVDAGGDLYHVSEERLSLEEIYFSLIDREHAETERESL